MSDEFTDLMREYKHAKADYDSAAARLSDARDVHRRAETAMVTASFELGVVQAKIDALGDRDDDPGGY